MDQPVRTPTPELHPSDLTHHDPRIGMVIDGRYRILTLIAVGGMGRVYKAEQTSLGRVVALKILSIAPNHSDQDPHFRERFALEAATASRLTNPHTVTIFDYGQTQDDIYYIVMEYVEGHTLSRILKTEGRMTPARAIGVAGQVCLSLREAHARGIVHRDIKPANVLLVNQGYELAKVLDFGIAKFLPESQPTGAELTNAGTYVGTPEYMAPEAFYGEADPRSDIYSVGVLLYLMLCGKIPFKAKTASATMLQVINEPVPEFAPELLVPLSLDTLIQRCLAKHPDDRFQSIDELLQAMSTCLQEAVGDVVALGHTISKVGQPLAVNARGSVTARIEMPPPPVPEERSPGTRWVAAGLLGAGIAAVIAVRLLYDPPVAVEPLPSVMVAPPKLQLEPDPMPPELLTIVPPSAASEGEGADDILPAHGSGDASVVSPGSAGSSDANSLETGAKAAQLVGNAVTTPAPANHRPSETAAGVTAPSESRSSSNSSKNASPVRPDAKKTTPAPPAKRAPKAEADRTGTTGDVAKTENEIPEGYKPSPY